MNKRIIGIDRNIINHANYRIGVVTSKFKAEAVLGALRGKHVNVLITDDDTATKMLALSNTK